MTADKTPAQEPELWTIKEFAVWLRMSTEAVRCRLKRGQFPPGTYVHIGRSIRFIRPNVRCWLARKAQ